MRHHFFLHYGWVFQNLGKEAVRTFMHTTVRSSDKSDTMELNYFLLNISDPNATLFISFQSNVNFINNFHIGCGQWPCLRIACK